MVIGLPFEEEKVLALMKSVEEPIKFEKHRKVPELETK